MQLRQKLSDIADAVIKQGRIGADQVKQLRLEIFSEARIIERMLEDGMVDREEALLLFSINDAVAEEHRDDSWRELFVEAVTSHVLKDEISPGALDEEEAGFILARVKGRGPLRSTELELLVNITASVTSAPLFFQSFVLEALKEEVLRDGFVGERAARMIRGVLLGSGSSSGKIIDEMERDWLRDVDALTAQEKNHPSWNLLKLEAGLL